MKFWTTLLFIFALPMVSLASEPKKVSLPLEVKYEMKTNDPSIEGKSWYRWTNKNFTVLCLNDNQAQYLHKHLEQVKTWAFGRWGLYETDFTAECRIIAVDDKALFKKMFNLEESRVEIRRDENGKIKMSIIFLLIDQTPFLAVPVPLTEVCMAELEQRYNDKFAWWATRGISLLNGSLGQIRGQLTDMRNILNSNRPMYFSKSLLEMTQEQYMRESKEKRDLFDKSAVVMCLFLRKEFGQDKMHWMIKHTANRGDGETALRKVCGFKSYNEFDQTFKRYMEDLTKDVVSGKTPDNYLQIKEVVED